VLAIVFIVHQRADQPAGLKELIEKARMFEKINEKNVKPEVVIDLPTNGRPTGKNALPFDWEHRRPCDFEYPKYVENRVGNYEPKPPQQKRAGAGEYGEEVKLDASLDDAVKKSIAEFGFNIVASDRISLDRAPKDLRKQECKHYDYPQKLPSCSVILVFHNEGWSPLMRTVHNVINMSPKELIHEVVLIDDGSKKVHLGDHLEEYIKRFNGLVKLYRNSRREGLIRARSIGAKKATGDILVYLDAHCEAQPNWLPPLITPIINDYRACTVPLIDVIDGNKYTFTEQAGGDENGHARGAWDWSLTWKRIPLTKKEKKLQERITEPYKSPAMAGGLFAISREYFFEIGLYDPGLEIWGGENFEISYKLWQCGGQLLFVPCSRVGHVYRLPGWHGNPQPSYVPPNFTNRNYKRVIDVWWGDYAKYFYMRRPEVQSLDTGDLTEQYAIRDRLQCRSFDWFMKEIAYDISARFPEIEKPSGAWGRIENPLTGKCVDGKFGGSGSPITVSDCSSGVGELSWWLTWHEDVRPGGHTADTARRVCLDCVGRNNLVSFWECHEMGGNQLWKYLPDKQQMFHSISNSCMEIQEGKLYSRECDVTNDHQRFVWTNLNQTQIDLFNMKLFEPVNQVDM